MTMLPNRSIIALDRYRPGPAPGSEFASEARDGLTDGVLARHRRHPDAVVHRVVGVWRLTDPEGTSLLTVANQYGCQPG
jgi:hypothetical protein